MPPALAAIALGSNLGDRRAYLASAFIGLAGLPGTRLLARSSLYETAPVGPIAQGPFLNAAALLSTTLTPRDLLLQLHALEAALGLDRAAKQKWGPRIIDLDLLTYADRVLTEPGLTLPHPRLHERRFVLAPLAEIAPDLIIPAHSLPTGDIFSAQTAAAALAALPIAAAPPPQLP